MRKIESIEDLSHYCLRKLGGGINEVEITEEQILDRINDALEYFIENHFDGTELKTIIKIIDDADIANGSIQLNDRVLAVVDCQTDANNGTTVSPYGVSVAGIGVISGPRVQDMALTGGLGQMTDYYILKGHLNLVNDILNAQPWVSFNATTKILTLQGTELQKGNAYFIKVYESVDDTVTEDVYNNKEVKKLAYLLMKEQLGINLSKYNGITLLGGTTINGREILNDAQNELDKFYSEFEERYQSIPSMFLG